MIRRLLPAVLAGAAWSAPARGQTALERLTFDEAVQRAVDRHPSVGEATQAILRAQALLDLARATFHPTLDGAVATTVLNEARGFDDSIFVPRTQTVFNATVSFPFLATARWARKNQAADQVGIAKTSAEDVRRQVAVTAAQAYLAVLNSERQREIARRNRDVAQALADYARARLDAGQGSRLNHVRSSQELASAEGLVEVAELAVSRAQEALGVAVYADGPVDVSGEPALPLAPPPSGDAWLADRPDVRLSTAELAAADRVVSDS